MGALIWAAAAAAAASSGAVARVDALTRWDSLILEAAHRARIPAVWVRRVMRAESGGRMMLGGRAITSSAGAMGLMQLMPVTWTEMRARLRLGDDPYDPHDNILAGAVFLRKMYDRFGYPGLFGAYNAGPGRYRAYLSGAALPRETKAYLAELTAVDAPLIQPSDPSRLSLFAAIHGGPHAAPRPADAGATLFAVRRDRPMVEPRGHPTWDGPQLDLR